jgi:hypothetical protein
MTHATDFFTASGPTSRDFWLFPPEQNEEYGTSSSSPNFAAISRQRVRRETLQLTGDKIFRPPLDALDHSERRLMVPPMTVDCASEHPDFERAEQRLYALASIDADEGFGDLAKPSEAIVREAGAILRKLAALGTGPFLPDLGLDADGTIVLTFHPDRCAVIGSLSVFGDGTYSFYVEYGDQSTEHGEAPISEPIPLQLQEFLAG